MGLADRIVALSTPEPTSGCWLWTGSMHRVGYGRVHVAGDAWLAHRASWLAFRGSDPGDMCVCHRCDNRACVNPDHLFLGTKADNSADMVAKGRAPSGERNAAHRRPDLYAPRGERCGAAKLSVADVLAVRSARARGETERSVAARFGVSMSLVGLIHRRERWRHLPL